MIAEVAVILCLLMVFFWFWTLEPKYGHHIPIVPEPWQIDYDRYSKISDNLAGWEGAVFEESE